MEVPDWEGGPGQDYPSLSAPAEAPISLNAQKKAKRKRKQQQTHLQALLDEPIHLMLHQPRNEGTGECSTKRSCATYLQLTETSRSVITPVCMSSFYCCRSTQNQEAKTQP